MGEFLKIFATKLYQLFTNEVFDGLHVVAGNGFGGGKGFYVSIREIFNNRTKRGNLWRKQWAAGRKQVAVGEVNQPLDLNLDAGAVQACFAQVLAEFDNCAAVTAVEGR